jgi:hypothetical protein
MSSSQRPISDAWYHRVKSATRDLVRMCGGVVRAGEIANTSKSEVSRWQSATDPDVISLPAALALEAECGVPMITAVMAELSGRRLSDPVHDASERGAANIAGHHAEFLRRAAEVTATTASALEDQSVSPAEAELIDRQLAEMVETIAAKRRSLAALKAGAGLRVVG